MPKPKLLPDQICPVCHSKQDKAVQEAEPIRNHVGEVKTVPDIVKLTDNEADVKKQQHDSGADLIPHPDFLSKEKEEGEDVGKNAAVKIWQSFLKAGH